MREEHSVPVLETAMTPNLVFVEFSLTFNFLINAVLVLLPYHTILISLRFLTWCKTLAID